MAISGALFDHHGVGNWKRCTTDVRFAGGVCEKKTTGVEVLVLKQKYMKCKTTKAQRFKKKEKKP